MVNMTYIQIGRSLLPLTFFLDLTSKLLLLYHCYNEHNFTLVTTLLIGKRIHNEHISFSIVQRSRKVSNAALPKTIEADQKVAEKVHYSTGAGSVYLNQNADYEAVKSPDEDIYEQAT